MNKDECHSQASTDHNVSHALIQGQFKGIRVTYIYTFQDQDVMDCLSITSLNVRMDLNGNGRPNKD